MKKYLLLAVLALFIGVDVFAQNTIWYGKNRGRSKNEENVGVRVGLNLASLKYTAPYIINDFATGNVAKSNRTGICFGAFYERTFEDKWIYGVELATVGRGMKMKNTFNGIYSGSQQENIIREYSFEANYLDIRIPVAYKFNIDDMFQPYISVTPNIGVNYGGHITESLKRESNGEFCKVKIYNPETNKWEQIDCNNKIEMGKANNQKLNLGVMVGAGFRSKIKLNKYKFFWLKLDGGYNIGFNNTFSAMELTAQNSNIARDANGMQVYKNTYKRSNRGVEIALSVSVPLHQAKKPAQNVRATQEQKQKNSSVKPTVVVKKMVVDKECYSLDEMISFVNDGADLTNKKICAFGEDINFATNESTLKSSSYGYLEKVVTMLEAHPDMIVQINGHTDNVGSDEINQRLSHNRAKAVFDYLVKSGVDSERLGYKGYGSSQPMDTNDTEEGRSKNRRVEIEIISL